MKKIYLILVVALAIVACKKSDQLPGDNGCITRVTRPNYNIKSSDSVEAINLFKQNNINYSDLRLSFVSLDTVPSGPNIGTYQQVFAVQIVNGLPILSGDLWYQFKNGTPQSIPVKAGSINLNTNSSLALTQVRAAYLAAVNKNNSTIAAGFKDSCLVAQFGYYNLNVNLNQPAEFVKAWMVSPKNSSYPEVFLQDGSGKTILYGGGAMLQFTQLPQ